MKKSIFFGCVFVIVIMLLLPCSSALTNKYNIENRDKKLLNEIKSEELGDSFILTFFVKFVLITQYYRMEFFANIAEGDGYNPFTEDIPHPMIYLWTLGLMFRMNIWATFWNALGIDVTISDFII